MKRFIPKDAVELVVILAIAVLVVLLAMLIASIKEPVVIDPGCQEYTAILGKKCEPTHYLNTTLAYPVCGCRFRME